VLPPAIKDLKICSASTSMAKAVMRPGCSRDGSGLFRICSCIYRIFIAIAGQKELISTKLYTVDV
jgi:hypothetical protein